MAFLSVEVSALENWLPWGSPVGTNSLAFHRHRVHQQIQVDKSNPFWAISPPPPGFLLFGFLPRSFYQAEWQGGGVGDSLSFLPLGDVAWCQWHELRFYAHYSFLQRGPSVSFLTSMGAARGPSHLVFFAQISSPWPVSELYNF